MRALRSTFALALLTAPLLADGGELLSRQESGPFVISVFAAPAPLRAGPIDMTILVQARDGRQPVLDAEVLIGLDGASQNVVASRAKAQNKLLYAATLQVPQPGERKFTIEVQSGAGRAIVSGRLTAGQPAPPLASYVVELAIPPVLIAIFGLHQWLSRRRVRLFAPS